MKQLIIGTALAASFLPYHAWATKDRGGGDVVKCQPTIVKGLNLNGYYTLDYIAQLTVSSPQGLAAASSNEALVSIEQKLRATIPVLGEHMYDFITTYGSQTLGYRVWRSGEQPLVNIQDENLNRALPEQCRTTYQAVFRTPIVVRDQTIRVFYDVNDEARQNIQNQPLQLSFLIVHEWLRDFIDDAFEIRAINWYLHSKQFQASSEQEVLNALSGFRFHDIILRVASEVNAERKEMSRTLAQAESDVRALCRFPENNRTNYMTKIGDIIVALDVASTISLPVDDTLNKKVRAYRKKIDEVQRVAIHSVRDAQALAGCN